MLHLLAIVNNAEINIGVQISLQDSNFNYFDKYPELGLKNPIKLPFVEETTFSPPCSLNTLVEDPSMMYVKVYSSALYSVSLVYMPGFRPAQYCFDYCSFAICFEIRECEASNFAFLSQNWFSYSRVI